jgi:hypothetical protein
MSHIGEEEKFTQALDGKLYGKIPFGRTKHKWENNIEMYQKNWDERVYTVRMSRSR